MEKKDESKTWGDSIPFDDVVVWSLGYESSFSERCSMCNTKEGRGVWKCTCVKVG
jgi:hypothetical protein